MPPYRVGEGIANGSLAILRAANEDAITVDIAPEPKLTRIMHEGWRA